MTTDYLIDKMILVVTNTFMLILLCLHIFWTYLIMQIAHKTLNDGQFVGDIRSSSEYSEDSKSE